MYWLYVLRSLKDERLYTGIAADRRERLREHNAGGVRSTRSRRPFVLVYSEPFETKQMRWPASVTLKRLKEALTQRLVRIAESKDNKI